MQISNNDIPLSHKISRRSCEAPTESFAKADSLAGESNNFLLRIIHISEWIREATDLWSEILSLKFTTQRSKKQRDKIAASAPGRSFDQDSRSIREIKVNRENGSKKDLNAKISQAREN